MPDSTLLMNFEIFLKTTSDYVCYIIVVLVMNDYVYNFWHITASLVFALVACWCLFKLWHKQFTHIKGNITLVLMHSVIVNGYQLLCLNHIGELLIFFLFYSLSSFVTLFNVT